MEINTFKRALGFVGRCRNHLALARPRHYPLRQCLTPIPTSPTPRASPARRGYGKRQPARPKGRPARLADERPYSRSTKNYVLCKRSSYEGRRSRSLRGRWARVGYCMVGGVSVVWDFAPEDILKAHSLC
jgi:hypothetical protein